MATPQARYAPYSYWSSLNPTLAKGVQVFASDTGRLYVGDGVTQFTSLSPVGGGTGTYVPAGGSTGQVLVKNSNTDGDVGWSTDTEDYLPLSGGTLTGILYLVPAAGNAEMVLASAAATSRIVRFRTGSSMRWGFLTNNTAESGSNAGSNFQINRYDDSGNYLGATLQLIRSTGEVRVEGDPTNALGVVTKQYADARAVPTGGTTDQVLAKASNTDRDLKWVTPTGGSGVAVDDANTILASQTFGG